MRLPSGTWQIPIFTIRCGGVDVMSFPLNVMRPSAFSTRFEIDMSVVVFPAPLPPMSVIISPLPTWRFMSVSAVTYP